MSRDPRHDAVNRALRELGEQLAGALRCGPYLLVQQIDRGAAGEVYAAARDGDGGAVRFALKLVRSVEHGAETIARFERERTILRALSHPDIVEVSDDGVLDDGTIWFAMPLIDGGPIDAACDERRLGVGARLSLVARACRVVGAVHAAGVIHRDLKPANILVRSRDGVPAPCIVDFGIARALAGIQPRLTPADTAHRLGTPAFMPPEQWAFGIGACDVRSDVFALGMVAAVVGAGVVARTEPDGRARSPRSRPAIGAPCAPSEAFRRLARADAASATRIAEARGASSVEGLAEEIASRLDPVCATALAEAPENRSASADALADALEKA